MTVIITKKLSNKEISDTLKKISAQKSKTGLRKHFGLALDKIDALDFQKKVRNEWD
jgi:hypothetical protein